MLPGGINKEDSPPGGGSPPASRRRRLLLLQFDRDLPRVVGDLDLQRGCLLGILGDVAARRLALRVKDAAYDDHLVAARRDALADRAVDGERAVGLDVGQVT